MELNEMTQATIGAAIEVHRALGPGLIESAYEECLCHELALRGIPFERQVPLPIEYKGVRLDCGYRLDLLIAKAVRRVVNDLDEAPRPLRLCGEPAGEEGRLRAPQAQPDPSRKETDRWNFVHPISSLQVPSKRRTT